MSDPLENPKDRFSHDAAYITGDKSQKTGSEKPTNTDSELNKEELENLDCTLIEELSSVVNVKDESDPVINREIKQLKYVSLSLQEATNSKPMVL